jgi:hypothetical protein
LNLRVKQFFRIKLVLPMWEEPCQGFRMCNGVSANSLLLWDFKSGGQADKLVLSP